jgi:hypothetical protein
MCEMLYTDSHGTLVLSLLLYSTTTSAVQMAGAVTEIMDSSSAHKYYWSAKSHGIGT